MTRALPPIERRLLSYDAARTYLGISLRAMKQLAADGEIRKTLIGHRVLFDVRDIDEFVERAKAAS